MAQYTVTELSEKFEQVFGIKIDAGIERVKLLMRRTITMGKAEAEAGLDCLGWDVQISYGRTTIDDRDFMMFAFFAMYGLEQFDALPKVEVLTAPPLALPQKR